jgi:PAS domain S-box-containing protein
MNKALAPVESARRADQLTRLQAKIVETTDDAVVALDSSMNIRYCNAAAEQLYGVRLPDVAGKALAAMHGFAWIKKEDEERFGSDLARQGSWRGEYIHILNNGSRIVVQSTVNVLERSAGGGMVAVIRDVTDRKMCELRWQKQSTELTRANEDLLHFAFAVGHDLGEHLRTVISSVQLLTAEHRQNLDRQASELLCLICEAASRMNLMLSDLLRFAQVAGKRGDFSEQVELEDALSTAMGTLNDAVAESGAVVTHDSLPAVAADRAQTAQLFQNLISNALKYRKPDTPVRVHVSANRTAGEWSIAVRDNGIGFDARIRDAFLAYLSGCTARKSPALE